MEQTGCWNRSAHCRSFLARGSLKDSVEAHTHFVGYIKKQPRSPVPFSVVSLVRLHNGAEVFALVDSCADSTAAVLATAQ
jgi:hypothetical protein